MPASARSVLALIQAERVRREGLSAGEDRVQIDLAGSRVMGDCNRRVCELTREVFGNPFRPPPPRRFPPEVRGLAEACFDDATNYPLLADALADLGEEAAADHCRTAGHVRGCHVVDWVAGRPCSAGESRPSLREGASDEGNRR